jgi:hypothetical protein
LRAVFVARQLAQFLQLGDNALRLEFPPHVAERSKARRKPSRAEKASRAN